MQNLTLLVSLVRGIVSDPEAELNHSSLHSTFTGSPLCLRHHARCWTNDMCPPETCYLELVSVAKYYTSSKEGELIISKEWGMRMDRWLMDHGRDGIWMAPYRTCWIFIGKGGSERSEVAACVEMASDLSGSAEKGQDPFETKQEERIGFRLSKSLNTMHRS